MERIKRMIEDENEEEEDTKEKKRIILIAKWSCKKQIGKRKNDEENEEIKIKTTTKTRQDEYKPYSFDFLPF